MAKDYYLGNVGVWRTLPNGVHIFILEGSDLETEMQKFDEPSWEIEYNKTLYSNEIVNKITYADFKYYYIDNNHNRIKPSDYVKRRIHKVFESRKYSNPEMDDFILNGLKHEVTELIINDRGTNWLKSDMFMRRLQIAIGPRFEMLDSFSHETAHAIDRSFGSKWYSYSYVSKKHNMTMLQAMKEECPSIEDIKHEQDAVIKLKQDEREFDQTQFLEQAEVALVDLAQALYGDKECKKTFGWLPHSAGYYSDTADPSNQSAELFAELTSSLFCDKNQTLYNIVKKHMPKTIEIYHEIIKEVKARWKTLKN